MPAHAFPPAPGAADRMSLYIESGAPSDATFDVADHHVVLDPAYVHITQASLSETARLKAVIVEHDVHSVGRYGGWTYCSIEDNLLETRALAQQLP